jgi:signal transduction histidine kinase
MISLIKRIIPERFIRSISTRLTFFMLFALSVSNLLSGIFLTVIYITDLKTTWDLGPVKITLIALGISYVSSGIFSIVLNKNILKPLKELTTATNEIAAGNFNIKVDNVLNPFNQSSELGTLVDGFNNMANELKSTEMFRNDFIHNFSHEFKTPIISIRGFARQLYQGNLTPEQEREFARIIMDESEQLANMYSNVLLLTKLENQEIVTDKTTFSLDEQLRNCLILFEEQWSEKNLNLDLDLEEITIHQNAEILAHVWKNIISNAIKFSKQNGFLNIKCKRTVDHIHISIEDTGSGMTEETMAQIFDKFYQGDTSHATPGNGLGLPLTKRIVEMVGGKIFVKSTYGKGSTFTVHLPLQ